MYDSELEYDGRLHILYDENGHSTADVISESDMYIITLIWLRIPVVSIRYGY